MSVVYICTITKRKYYPIYIGLVSGLDIGYKAALKWDDVVL